VRRQVDEIEKRQEALQDTFFVIVLGIIFIGALFSVMFWISWAQLIQLQPLVKLVVLLVFFVLSLFICKLVFGIIKNIYYRMYYS